MADDFVILPLHTRWDLLSSCVDLLNSEWKRSAEARAHSLRKSSENFPISLVMFRKIRPREVLGHSRLTFIIGKSGACFVESVVVSKTERGRGLGRILMKGTEHYMKNRGFTEIFLFTHDALEFYKAVGYHVCPPVTTGGLIGVPQSGQLIEKISQANSDRVSPESGNAGPSTVHEGDSLTIAKTVDGFEVAASRPPPPPPLPTPWKNKSYTSVAGLTIEHHPNITVFYMTKAL